MRQALEMVNPVYVPYSSIPQARSPANEEVGLRCSWHEMRIQLLQQWNRLNEQDVDKAGNNRHKIAQLIQREYGISALLIENYLRNFERTLPVM